MQAWLMRLTLGLLVWGQTALAVDTGRKVFAHYMVCIPTYGGSSKVEDYQREIRAAPSRAWACAAVPTPVGWRQAEAGDACDTAARA